MRRTTIMMAKFKEKVLAYINYSDSVSLFALCVILCCRAIEHAEYGLLLV